MSWFGWGAKPKTDMDLMEKSLTKEDKKYYDIMINHFESQGYKKELSQLYPDTIHRFVTGYAHCEEREKETKAKIQHFLDTYRAYDFNNILNDNNIDKKKELEYCNAWPLFCYGYDKYGHPIYYDCVGDCKEDAIAKTFEITDVENEDQYKTLMRYKYAFMKRMHNAKRIQSDIKGKMIYKHLLIFDVKNVSLSISEFTGKKAQFAKKVIGSDQDMFPDTLYRLYIINASFTFRAIWKIIRAFVDPITAEKIQVLGSDYLTELTKQVAIDQIPKEYGGQGKLEIKRGYVADLEDDHYPQRKNKNQNNQTDNDADDKKTNDNDVNHSKEKPNTESNGANSGDNGGVMKSAAA